MFVRRGGLIIRITKSIAICNLLCSLPYTILHEVQLHVQLVGVLYYSDIEHSRREMEVSGSLNTIDFLVQTIKGPPSIVSTSIVAYF